MSYQQRGYPAVALNRHMQVMDDNHTRVTECIKPIKLDITPRGLLACVAPINQELSDIAAHQKPLDTTICDILGNPAAFNNKMVRIRGRYSGNFEYSTLGSGSCSGSLWLAYPGGGGPPNLAAYVSVANIIGAKDAEGRRILPVPMTLVRDAKFERFQKAVVSVSGNSERVPLETDAPEPRFATATFIGRIDAVSSEVHEYLKTQTLDKRSGLGFGQMGSFEAQLTLQSVEDDAVLE